MRWLVKTTPFFAQAVRSAHLDANNEPSAAFLDCVVRERHYLYVCRLRPLGWVERCYLLPPSLGLLSVADE